MKKEKTMIRNVIIAMFALCLSTAAFAEEQACDSDADCSANSQCVKEPCMTCIPDEECPPCDTNGHCVSFEQEQVETGLE